MVPRSAPSFSGLGSRLRPARPARHSRLMPALLLLTALATMAALAPAPARADEPLTCALAADPALGLPDSAAFNLLSTQLAAQPDLALLERADVARLLKERSLQLALAADGIGERRALGALLKAQLLIILRAGEQTIDGRAIRFIDLAIADTASGLRLAQDRLAWDESTPQTLAQPVIAALNIARRRLAEPLRAILAVPPFVSDDLDRRQDALQEACARLLIESLAATPGLRLVELAEARALAQEQRRTGGAPLRRELMPCYLNGRYRNEGRGDARTIRLSLELTRGAESLGRIDANPIPPAQAAPALRRDAADLLARFLKVTPAPFDPQAESAALARKAGQFRALGEWDKAFTLTEAALLLSPDDLLLHRQAVACATPLIENVDTAHLESLRRTVATALRALDHFELYLRRTDFNSIHNDTDRWKAEQDFVLAFWTAGRRALGHRLSDPESRALVTELGKAKRDLLLAWAETQAGYPAPKVAPALYPPDTDWREIGRPFTGVFIDEPSAETAQVLLRMARSMWKYSRGKDVLVISNLARTPLGDPKAQADFLAQLAQLPGPQYPLLVRMVQAEGLSDKQRRLEELGKLMVEAGSAVQDAEVRGRLLQLLQMDCKGLNSRLHTGSRPIPGALATSSATPTVAPAASLSQATRRSPSSPSPTAPAAPSPGMGVPQRQAPVSIYPPASLSAGGPDYTLEPILSIDSPLLGWIQAGPDADLLWDQQNIYHLPGAGMPQPLVSIQCNDSPDPSRRDVPAEQDQPVTLSVIYPAPSASGTAILASASAGQFTDVVFDGRLAWAPLRNHILVIDPASGEVAILGDAEGLPPGRIMVAPLAPGRVCAVGGFGRAWCAVIERNPSGRFKIDIFHEARLAEGAPTDPALAFLPRFAATLRDPAGHTFVLVGRQRDDAAQYFPLLLDPDRRQAQVIPQRLSSRLQSSTIQSLAGDLYWVANTRDLKGPGIATPVATPEKHVYRLERVNLAARRIETLFSELPPSAGREAGNPWPDGSDYPRLAFDRDQGYLFTDACWLLDRQANRLIRLRGERPTGLAAPRFGHSSRYGLVLLASGARPNTPVCYAFRPRAGLAQTLAADPAGRQVIEQQNSLEGRFAILRRYPEGSDDAWTTFTVPIAAGALLIEREDASTGTLLALAGEDQRDPDLRRYFGREIKLFDRRASDRLTRDNPTVHRDDPVVLPLKSPAPFHATPSPAPVPGPASRPGFANMPGLIPPLGGGPRTLTFTDALGQPLAGAEVRPVQYYIPTGPGGYFDPQWKGTPRSIKLPALRTDAGGQVTYDAPPPGSGNGGQFEISHPDYGRVELSLFFSELSVTLPRLTGRPAGQERLPIDNLARQAVPLVRRGTPEARRAFRGRVLDPQGRPVAGARLYALPPLKSMPILYWESKVVVSDAEGRFSLYPPTPDLFKPYLPNIADNSTVTLLAYTPGRPELPTWIGALNNRAAHDITLGQPPRPHRFVFQDVQGRPLDPAALKPVVTFRDGARRFGGPAPQVVFDGKSAPTLPAALPLRHGLYSATADGGIYFNQVRVTADSPEEIVFTQPPPPPPVNRAAMPPWVRAHMPPPGGSPLDTPTPTPGAPAPAGSSLALTWSGVVLDAVTGKPVPGAVVFSWDFNFNRRLFDLDDAQWRALHEFHGPFDLEQAAALAPFKAALGHGLITRADANGRFTLTRKPWERVSGIIAMEQHYLGVQMMTESLAAGPGGRVELPPFKLYPAGQLRVRFAPENKNASNSDISPNFAFTDPDRGLWSMVFPGLHNGRTTHYVYDESLYVSERPLNVPVPAGVEFRISFSGCSAIGRPLQLRQGETLDLGTLVVR